MNVAHAVSVWWWRELARLYLEEDLLAARAHCCFWRQLGLAIPLRKPRRAELILHLRRHRRRAGLPQLVAQLRECSGEVHSSCDVGAKLRLQLL